MLSLHAKLRHCCPVNGGLSAPPRFRPPQIGVCIWTFSFSLHADGIAALQIYQVLDTVTGSIASGLAPLACPDVLLRMQVERR
jgi:hypothetical protein